MFEERSQNRRLYATGAVTLAGVVIGALTWTHLAGAEPPSARAVGAPDRPGLTPTPAEAVPPGRKVPEPAAVVPLAKETPAKLIVDPPRPEPLARGVAFIQYRTENLQVVPAFGGAATAVSPRVGHLHATVDDTPWHWAHTSGGPVIVADLPPGPHKILIELADANHRSLAREVVRFDVPQR